MCVYDFFMVKYFELLASGRRAYSPRNSGDCCRRTNGVRELENTTLGGGPQARRCCAQGLAGRPSGSRSSTRWNRKKAAEMLGVSYKTLLKKIKETGIEPPSAACA